MEQTKQASEKRAKRRSSKIPRGHISVKEPTKIHGKRSRYSFNGSPGSLGPFYNNLNLYSHSSLVFQFVPQCLLIDIHWISLGYHTFKRWPIDIYRISCASWWIRKGEAGPRCALKRTKINTRKEVFKWHVYSNLVNLPVSELGHAPSVTIKGKKNKIRRLIKSFDREAVNFSHVNISLLPKLAARLSLFVTHVRTLKVSHPPEGGGRFDGGDR